MFFFWPPLQEGQADPRVARVKVSSTLIYLDPTLLKPAGELKQGTLVKVEINGETLDQTPVLPLTLAQKTYFVPKKHLEILTSLQKIEPTPKLSETPKTAETGGTIETAEGLDARDQGRKSDWSKTLSLQYHLFQPGKTWEKMEKILGEKSSFGHQLQILGEIWPQKALNLHAGIFNSQIIGTLLSFRATGLLFGTTLRIDWSSFSLYPSLNFFTDLQASYLYSPFAALKLVHETEEGNLLGPQFSLGTQFTLDPSWFLKMGLAYSFLHSERISLNSTVNQQEIKMEEIDLTGAHFYLGILHLF